MRCGRPLALLALVACLLAPAACGGNGDEGEGGGSVLDEPGAQAPAGTRIARNPDNADVSITVGSKNFTEQKILGEVYAQGLEAAGYRVATKLSLGDERVAQQALADDVVDGYPEYTGTALLSLCGVPTARIPKVPAEAFEDARACFRRDGLTAFPPTPFTNSNEVAVQRRLAEREGLRAISDLRGIDERITLFGPPECRERSDCLRGLRETYGLRFKAFRPVPTDERHAVLREGGDVASIVFTTDPQNRRENLVLLQDDQGMFPPYNSTFVVRDDVADGAGPDLQRVVEAVQRGLTDEVMQELNARVDLDGEAPDDVARAYLDETGLLPGS